MAPDLTDAFGKTSTQSRPKLDPELAAISVLIPRFDLSDIVRARALERSLALQGHTPLADVLRTDFEVAGNNRNVIAVRVYRPAKTASRLPALFYIHGGGFTLGGIHTEEERCDLYARDAGCVVVSLDYRLAPEHPFPAPFDDCISVLTWILDNAPGLNIDPSRLAIGGNSAGGTLAAAVALQWRSSGRQQLVHQLLINPALDCRCETYSALNFVETPVWTRADNLFMWQAYLGSDVEPVDYRASPTLVDDVAGVAPATFWIGEYDPLRDEAYEYALRLLHAGVPVGLYQHPGTFHGFDSYRMTKLGKRVLDEQISTLKGVFVR